MTENGALAQEARELLPIDTKTEIVVTAVGIERNACGGCFNKIPPQRQLDIGTRKKIIVCEYCGRILVDDKLAEEIESELIKR